MPKFVLRLSKTLSIPLHLLLVVQYGLQISVVVGLVGYLSYLNGQKSVNDLAERLRQEISDRVAQHLESYMEVPKRLTRLNAETIQKRIVNPNQHKLLEQFFWQQVNSFNIGFVLYGLPSGDFESAGYVFDNRITIGYVNQAKHRNPNLYIWEADRQGQRTRKLVGDFGAYPFKEEAWYKQATKRQQLAWTPVYNWQAAPYSLAIAVSQPIYDANHRLQGVIGIEQRLSQISDFLRHLQDRPTFKTFIMERNGLLIGSSVNEPPFHVIGGKPYRLNAMASKDQLIKTTAQQLNQRFGNFSQIHQTQLMDFSFNHQRYFVQLTPWKDNLGIDWLVVIVMPESDFMEQINANTYTTFWLSVLALLIAVILASYTSRWMIRPIELLSQASEAIATGELDQQVKTSRVTELSVLAKSFNHMAMRLRESFTQLEYNAHHDALTNLPNRTALMAKLQAAIVLSACRAVSFKNHTCSDPNPLFAVLFLDLDYFKLVNDSLGHLKGDLLLLEVATRLNACVSTARAKTCSDLTTLARFGGDEFVILLDAISDVSEVIELAEAISQALQQPFQLEDDEVFISASIGIVLKTVATLAENDHPETFIRNADIALYRAKEKGKACYEIFDTQMHKEAVERLQLETDLRRALLTSTQVDNIFGQEFEVYYQPIFAISTYQITGFEALVRWHHSTRGMISPALFIPIAEETGLIVKLGWLVMHQACQQMRLWQQQWDICRSMTMSVNLSSKQFLQKDLIHQIEKVLNATGLSPHCLKLEMTESILMNHGEVTQAKLRQLSNEGIRLSLDDFGTGYSSLSYLHSFPISTLKIDRSFMGRLESTGENREVVEAIIVLAHKLGMDVVAEGVETVEHLEQLQIMNCDQAQGYLFSPPNTASRITTWLTDTLIHSSCSNTGKDTLRNLQLNITTQKTYHQLQE